MLVYNEKNSSPRSSASSFIIGQLQKTRRCLTVKNKVHPSDIVRYRKSISVYQSSAERNLSSKTIVWNKKDDKKYQKAILKKILSLISNKNVKFTQKGHSQSTPSNGIVAIPYHKEGNDLKAVGKYIVVNNQENDESPTCLEKNYCIEQSCKSKACSCKPFVSTKSIEVVIKQDPHPRKNYRPFVIPEFEKLKPDNEKEELFSVPQIPQEEVDKQKNREEKQKRRCCFKRKKPKAKPESKLNLTKSETAFNKQIQTTPVALTNRNLQAKPQTENTSTVISIHGGNDDRKGPGTGNIPGAVYLCEKCGGDLRKTSENSLHNTHKNVCKSCGQCRFDSNKPNNLKDKYGEQISHNNTVILPNAEKQTDMETLKMMIKMETRQNHRTMNDIINELNKHKKEIKKLKIYHEEITNKLKDDLAGKNNILTDKKNSSENSGNAFYFETETHITTYNNGEQKPQHPDISSMHRGSLNVYDGALRENINQTRGEHGMSSIQRNSYLETDNVNYNHQRNIDNRPKDYRRNTTDAENFDQMKLNPSTYLPKRNDDVLEDQSKGRNSLATSAANYNQYPNQTSQIQRRHHLDPSSFNLGPNVDQSDMNRKRYSLRRDESRVDRNINRTNYPHTINPNDKNNNQPYILITDENGVNRNINGTYYPHTINPNDTNNRNDIVREQRNGLVQEMINYGDKPKMNVDCRGMCPDNQRYYSTDVLHRDNVSNVKRLYDFREEDNKRPINWKIETKEDNRNCHCLYGHYNLEFANDTYGIETHRIFSSNIQGRTKEEKNSKNVQNLPRQGRNNTCSYKDKPAEIYSSESLGRNTKTILLMKDVVVQTERKLSSPNALERKSNTTSLSSEIIEKVDYSEKDVNNTKTSKPDTHGEKNKQELQDKDIDPFYTRCFKSIWEKLTCKKE